MLTTHAEARIESTGAPAHSVRGERLSDWEAPAGRAESTRHPSSQPAFTYIGHADAHLRGQTCHVLAATAAEPDERVVVMSCGCRLSVPWWTLEPQN